MRLTNKAHYAVRAIFDLALHNHQRHAISLNEIAERQSISLSFLEQLFPQLRRAGIVNSVRGPGGGYCLAKPADRISIEEVLDAIDELTDVPHCEEMPQAHYGTAKLWCDLSREIRGFLGNISVQDAISRHEVQEIAQREDARYQHRVYIN